MKIIISECLNELFKTSGLWLVALLTAKYCQKVVDDRYAPNEIRQEFLFVAMTYAFGSLTFKYVMRICNSWACLFWCILVYLGMCTS